MSARPIAGTADAGDTIAMSFLVPDPLPRRQKIVAVVAVLLMIPVLLDAFKVIHLGELRMAPFFLLLACVPFTWESRRQANEEQAELRPPPSPPKLSDL
jgi:hypothetical protein